MNFARLTRLFLPAVLISVALAARADVSRIDIKSRTDVLNGKVWGNTGTYEKLTGKVYFTADPNNPHNKIIPNFDKAPRNARSMVEFSANIVILAPKDPAKGNSVADKGNRSAARQPQ